MYEELSEKLPQVHRWVSREFQRYAVFHTSPCLFLAPSTSYHRAGTSLLQVWDLGGQSSIRPYWRCYYPNTHAIVFVVDSADTDRLETARAELMAMLEV